MPKLCRRPLRTSQGALDAGVGHDSGDLPVSGRSRPRPEGLAGGLRRRRTERVDEFETAEQFERDGDLAPVLGAVLQGPDPDRGGLKVDVLGANGQGFRNPGAGVGEREGESLVGRPQRPGGGLEEAPALIGSETFGRAEIRGSARRWSSSEQAPRLRGVHGFSRDALEELFGKKTFPDRQRGLYKGEILIFVSPFDRSPGARQIARHDRERVQGHRGNRPVFPKPAQRRKLERGVGAERRGMGRERLPPDVVVGVIHAGAERGSGAVVVVYGADFCKRPAATLQTVDRNLS